MRAMLEILAQRIGRRRDATRALTQVRTRGVALPLPRALNADPRLGVQTVFQRYCLLESDKSQGLGDRVPIEEMIFFRIENILTNGGESASARVPLLALLNGTRTPSYRVRAGSMLALPLLIRSPRIPRQDFRVCDQT